MKIILNYLTNEYEIDFVQPTIPPAYNRCFKFTKEDDDLLEWWNVYRSDKDRYYITYGSQGKGMWGMYQYPMLVFQGEIENLEDFKYLEKILKIK